MARIAGTILTSPHVLACALSGIFCSCLNPQTFGGDYDFLAATPYNGFNNVGHQLFNERCLAIGF
jgi:hypothetical protein